MVNKTPAELVSGTPNDNSVVHSSEDGTTDSSKKHNEREISRMQGTAPLYSALKTYNLNDLVTEAGLVYRNIIAIGTPEVFDPAKWQSLEGLIWSADQDAVGFDLLDLNAVNDSFDNEILRFITSGASAVNFFNIQSSDSLAPLVISAEGTDAEIDIVIFAKGSEGKVIVPSVFETSNYQFSSGIDPGAGIVNIRSNGLDIIYNVRAGGTHDFDIEGVHFFEIGELGIIVNEVGLLGVNTITQQNTDGSTIFHQAQVGIPVVGTAMFDFEVENISTFIYNQIQYIPRNITGGTQEGEMSIQCVTGGALTEFLSINDAGSGNILFGATADLNTLNIDNMGYIRFAVPAEGSIPPDDEFWLGRDFDPFGIAVNMPTGFGWLQTINGEFILDVNAGTMIKYSGTTSPISSFGLVSRFPTIAVGDTTAEITFQGQRDAGGDSVYAIINAVVRDRSASNYTGELDLSVRVNAATKSFLHLNKGGNTNAVFGSGVHVQIDNSYLQLDSIASPGVTGSATIGRLFMDSGNSNVLSIIRNGAVIDLETPQEFLGPWTADHDAGGFDLLNVGGITINNPADTFQYILTPAAILADRILNLPLLTGTDTIVTEAFPQSITNKTLGSGTIFSVNPTINDGIKFTFNPDNTNAGLNVGANPTDPSSPINGDMYYDSANDQLKGRIGAAWLDIGGDVKGGTGPYTVDGIPRYADATGTLLEDVAAQPVTLNGAGVFQGVRGIEFENRNNTDHTIDYIQVHDNKFEINVKDGTALFEIEFEGIDEYVWTKTEADWEGKDLINLGVLNLGVMGVLTIAGGAITVTKSFHRLAGQGDMADTLTTINGGIEGDLLILQSDANANNITVTEAGNIFLENTTDEFIMNNIRDKLTLVCTGGNWEELSRSLNN